MRFTKVKINNFRQYYKTVEFDLDTNEEQNLIVIGGKNGYGKTNFLISIVWCLYGDKIVQVDQNFKEEIQKEKNYSSFMQQSINWTAQKQGVDTFSVSILIDDIEAPEISKLNAKPKSILITRSRNTSNTDEELSIVEPNTGIELFDEEADKINFINDYIIPVDAAKFVFFDAEKIAQIANLSIKEQGNFINDALGKILGLDIYETLIEDFKTYINKLKREGANKNLKEQIVDKEKAIELNELKIESLEEENAEREKDIDEKTKEIRYFDNLISKKSKQGNSSFDRDSIISEIKDLTDKKTELSDRFNELSEVIPLIILAGKLEEVKEHLSLQKGNDLAKELSKENTERLEQFIELLFNKPPEPENSSMSFKDKHFYYEKAMRLGAELYDNKHEVHELDFDYDLNNAEKDLISDAINLINTQSSEFFKSTIDEFNTINVRIDELERLLNKIDADLEDEIILEYIASKETAEHSIESNNRKIGGNIEHIDKLLKDNKRLNQQLVALTNKVKVNESNRLKIKESEKYISVLTTFVEEQKNQHKDSLEKTILNGLRSLMHKLLSDKNKFIEDVRVTILAAGQGMKVTLLDQDDNEIRKESLSSGEKQIYISCLIKAILNESIQSLPIFIDTPLGRLDEEHRDTITKEYYPSLSEQVVLFSTNSEITPKRFRDINENVAKSYLLINDGANTNLKKGYFNTVSND